MAIGATFIFLGAILGAVAALAAWTESYGAFFMFYLPILILIPLGTLAFFIGAFPFCARWGAQGGRIAELEELTNALLAAHAQRQRDAASAAQPEGERR